MDGGSRLIVKLMRLNGSEKANNNVRAKQQTKRMGVIISLERHTVRESTSTVEEAPRNPYGTRPFAKNDRRHAERLMADAVHHCTTRETRIQSAPCLPLGTFKNISCSSLTCFPNDFPFSGVSSDSESDIDDYDWKELSKEQKKAAETLGYTKKVCTGNILS